jgi:hypothetical protein
MHSIKNAGMRNNISWIRKHEQKKILTVITKMLRGKEFKDVNLLLKLSDLANSFSEY